MKLRRWLRKHIIHPILFTIASLLLVSFGIGALWVATLPMPDLHSFENRKVVESTKIYDRTGTILLYDTGKDARRTEVTLAEISPDIQNAAIAIEDEDFYSNIGVEPVSFMRAIIANITSRSFEQGASTITQQVVKNSLLTRDKTIKRKIKEWVLAIKLTRTVSKQQILEVYLNETSYGGTIYGVEEASQIFFGRPAKDVTLAQAAYLAAIPQAPTYYSPYGNNRESLDNRQRLVLKRMLDLEFISPEEHESAKAETVKFLTKADSNIRAPHFVMYVMEYLTKKYGEERVTSGGLRVITTLDYDMQQKAEEVTDRFAPTLASNFEANNVAMVAIDPKTGDILSMVGSRDYFDQDNEGNFNVTLAKRQPGSTFKPFVYATLFQKGYTTETVLFDVKTEFSSRCTVDGKPKNPSDDPAKTCYSPNDYDGQFPGPMTVRRALAQSRNVPAVKALYLAGIKDSIDTAERMGITSLTEPDRYGLTLVLGGGEVSLLELTGAYGVFANDGIRNPNRSVLEVNDGNSNILEKAEARPIQAIAPEVARQISDILSDDVHRINSLRPIAESIERQVAIKTGTTNDFRDVWTVGYTSGLVVGAWAGKNDNTPMKQSAAAGLIISPIWGAFMSQTARNFPGEPFKEPLPLPQDTKPVMHGVWQGGQSYWIDTVSGKVATEHTPTETRKEVVFNNVHTILHWVDPADPLGPIPTNPAQDSQYENWEHGVRRWFENWKRSNPEFVEVSNISIPTATDDVHLPGNGPSPSIILPQASTTKATSLLPVQIRITGTSPALKTEVHLNGRYVLTADKSPLSFSFVPADAGGVAGLNTLSVTVYDTAYNKGQATTELILE